MDKIEITVKVNGKSVPLSTISNETISKIKQEEVEILEEDVPVFHKYANERLIIKLTPRVLRILKNFVDQDYGCAKYVSMEADGNIGTYFLGNTWEEVSKFYSSIEKPTTIF